MTLETGQNALLCVKEELKQEKELVLNLLQKTEELTVQERVLKLEIATSRTAQVILLLELK